MKNIDIGKKIQDVFKKNPMTMVGFAKQVGVNRQVAYNIFARKSINTALLQRISVVLEHNFFQYYSDVLKLKKK